MGYPGATTRTILGPRRRTYIVAFRQIDRDCKAILKELRGEVRDQKGEFADLLEEQVLFSETEVQMGTPDPIPDSRITKGQALIHQHLD